MYKRLIEIAAIFLLLGVIVFFTKEWVYGLISAAIGMLVLITSFIKNVKIGEENSNSKK